VKLAIYNLLGEKIRTLVNAQQPAGIQQATWDGRDEHGRRVSSGVYLYRLEAGDFTMTKRLLLMK
jgi:flagellar hook assembly protein FlgD